MAEQITQAIGTTNCFGYLLEDGINIPEQNILLGGSIDEETGEAEEPHYKVTSAWQEGSLVVVNATLVK